jgi:hypothetical protein
MTCCASAHRHSVDVGCQRRPSDQSWRTEGSHINVKIVGCLRRVGRYDFQVLPSAQGNEGVSGANTRMGSANNGFNSRYSLNLCNSTIQIRYPD